MGWSNTFNQGTNEYLAKAEKEYGVKKDHDGQANSGLHQYYIGGKCHFLSLYWLALKMSDRDFFRWMEGEGNKLQALRNARVIVEETLLYKQKNFDVKGIEAKLNSGNSADWPKYYKEYSKLYSKGTAKKRVDYASEFRTFDTKAENDAEFMEGWSLENVGESVKKRRAFKPLFANPAEALNWLLENTDSNNRAYSIHLHAKASAHVLGMVKMNGKSEFFDCNHGTIRHPDANTFKADLALEFRRYFKKYDRSWRVVEWKPT